MRNENDKVHATTAKTEGQLKGLPEHKAVKRVVCDVGAEVRSCVDPAFCAHLFLVSLNTPSGRSLNHLLRLISGQS
jgi:hypothetical protein